MEEDNFWSESESESENSNLSNVNNNSSINNSSDENTSFINSNSDSSSSSDDNNLKKKEINDDPIHRHKRNIKYKINPINLPRPSFNDLIYVNINKNEIYYSGNDYNNIPSPNSNFINYEKGCSSIRLIRPSMFYLPYDIKFYSKTIKYYGFNIEPFANEKKGYEEILKVTLNIDDKYNKKIFQCQVCNAYYHPNLFEIIKLKSNLHFNYYTYYCKICLMKRNFYTINNQNIINFNIDNNLKVNKNFIYFLPNIGYEGKEVNLPYSIDYILNEENIEYNIKEIIIIYLDISNNSLKYGFITYVLESLNQIIKNNNENCFEYIIATYNYKYISYYYIYNHSIKVCIMNDKKNPFFPMSINTLKNNSENTIKIIEKINSILKENNETNNELSDLDLCINSANNILETNIFNNIFYNILIFSSNNSHFSNDKFFKINKQITFTFFITSGNNNNNYFPLNFIKERNFNFNYYFIDYSDSDDYIQKFERLYYDIFNIISTNKTHIYNVTYNLIYSKNIFYLNEEKIKEGKNTISIINNFSDFNLVYSMKQFTYFPFENKIYFQFQISYLSPIDNKKHLRILNYNTRQSKSIEELFNTLDTETLLRVLLQQYFNESKNINDINEILKIKEEISTIIINLLTVYKSEVFLGKTFRCLSYPSSLNNIFAYFFSFFERVENNLVYLIYLYRNPLSIFFLQIYPFLFRIKYNDVILDGLSYFFLRTNKLLFLNDGYYNSIYILKDVKQIILSKYFHVETFEELIKLKNENKLNFYYNEFEIFKKIMDNKPLKIILVDDNYVLNNKFTSIFIEDRQISKPNYSQFIYNIQNNISDNLFEI